MNFLLGGTPASLIPVYSSHDCRIVVNFVMAFLNNCFSRNRPFPLGQKGQRYDTIASFPVEGCDMFGLFNYFSAVKNDDSTPPRAVTIDHSAATEEKISA